MKHQVILTALLLSFGLFSAPLAHAGHNLRYDTDGFVGKGEIPNPRINYSNADWWRPPPDKNPHAGKVDSDGILSSGEIPNPLINYNKRPTYYQSDYGRRPWYNDNYQRHPERDCDRKDSKYNYYRPSRERPNWWRLW